MDEIGGDPGAEFPANGLMGLFDFVDRNLARIGHRVGIVHELQAQGLLRASSLLLGLVGLLLLLALPPVVGWGLRRAGRLETNFRGERIPQSFGLVTLLWSCAMLAATAFLYREQRDRSLVWLAGCAGYGLLGLIDDTFGARDIKGLGGHLRAAVRDHRITTGFLKAAGGLLLAFWLALRLKPTTPATTLVGTCVIALCANAINLLDLRPGRAGAVFLVGALPVLALAWNRGEAGVPPLLLVAIPALRVWAPDAEGRIMMGDTGSNLLGGALGMGLVSTCPAWGVAATAALLVGLHVLAERRSLTTIIQNNRLLRALDRLTGVR